jgi:hypothetical protein
MKELGRLSDMRTPHALSDVQFGLAHSELQQKKGPYLDASVGPMRSQALSDWVSGHAPCDQVRLQLSLPAADELWQILNRARNARRLGQRFKEISTLDEEDMSQALLQEKAMLDVALQWVLWTREVSKKSHESQHMGASIP